MLRPILTVIIDITYDFESFYMHYVYWKLGIKVFFFCSDQGPLEQFPTPGQPYTVYFGLNSAVYLNVIATLTLY